jgi:hypothetical protein
MVVEVHTHGPKHAAQMVTDLVAAGLSARLSGSRVRIDVTAPTAMATLRHSKLAGLIANIEGNSG